MNQLGTDLISYVVATTLIGILVAQITQIVKRKKNYCGTAVAWVNAGISFALGESILLLTTDAHGWKPILLVVIRGGFAAVMIFLSASGLHNLGRVFRDALGLPDTSADDATTITNQVTLPGGSAPLPNMLPTTDAPAPSEPSTQPEQATEQQDNVNSN